MSKTVKTSPLSDPALIDPTPDISISDKTVLQFLEFLQRELTTFHSLMCRPPFPKPLSSTERRRLQGSGVKRYGFIDKTSDVSEMFFQVHPKLLSDE